MTSRIALEAIKGQKAIQEIASHCGVHPDQSHKVEAAGGSGLVFVICRSAIKSDRARRHLWRVPLTDLPDPGGLGLVEKEIRAFA
jgi:hypothetical protein